MKKLILNNPLTFTAAAIALLVLLFAIGCESKVSSINRPSYFITRAELEAEVDSFLAIAKIRFDQLNQQDAFKKIVFEQASIIATGGTINPLGLITTIGTILGVGATSDNIRLRKKLKNNGTA